MEVTKRQNNFLHKRCRVCGDNAVGFNFNVLTCVSCKLFFRRNVLLRESLKCCFEKNCPINASNRNDCKSCRMRKCVEVGMKQDILFSRIERKQKTLKLEPEDSKVEIIKFYKNSTDLKGVELERLTEVRNAVTQFHDLEDLPKVGIAENFIQLANIDANSTQSVVKCCKGFSAFNNLYRSDQIVLLKKFYAERGFFQWAFHYDEEQEGCYVVVTTTEGETENKARLLVKESMIQACTSDESFLLFKNFTHSLHREMDNDPAILELLLGQLLFKQSENTTKSKEYIRYNYFLYGYLLNRYLEVKYGNVDKAKEKLDILMDISNQVEQVLNVFKGIYYHILTKQHKVSEQLIDALTAIEKSLYFNFDKM